MTTTTTKEERVPNYYDPHFNIRKLGGKSRWYPFMTKSLYLEFEHMLKTN